MIKVLFALLSVWFFNVEVSENPGETAPELKNLVLQINPQYRVGHISANGGAEIDGINLTSKALINGKQVELSYFSLVGDPQVGNFYVGLRASFVGSDRVLILTTPTVEAGKQAHCDAISHLCENKGKGSCDFDFQDGCIVGCQSQEGQCNHSIGTAMANGEMKELLKILINSCEKLKAD